MKADETSNQTLSMSYTKLFLNLLFLISKLLTGFLENSMLLVASSVRAFSKFITQAASFKEFLFVKKARIDSFNQEMEKK